MTSALQGTSLMTFTLLILREECEEEKKRKPTALTGKNKFGEKKKKFFFKKMEENSFFQVNTDLSPAKRSLLYSPGTRGLQINLDS